LAGTTNQRARDEPSFAHRESPTITHFDSLGRAFLVVADNRSAGTYATSSALDIQGRVTSVTDARNVVVAEHTFDVLGAKLKNVSVDAGTTKALGDVIGRPIRAWSARGYASRVKYDANGRRIAT
jgi:YD repeat-containing protein